MIPISGVVNICLFALIKASTILIHNLYLDLSPLKFLGGQHLSVPFPFVAAGYKFSDDGRVCWTRGGVFGILGSIISTGSDIAGEVGSENGFPNTDVAHA